MVFSEPNPGQHEPSMFFRHLSRIGRDAVLQESSTNAGQVRHVPTYGTPAVFGPCKFSKAASITPPPILAVQDMVAEKEPASTQLACASLKAGGSMSFSPTARGLKNNTQMESVASGFDLIVAAPARSWRC